MTYISVYHNKSHIHGIGVFTPVNLKGGDTIGVSHAYYDKFWYMTITLEVPYEWWSKPKINNTPNRPTRIANNFLYENFSS